MPRAVPMGTFSSATKPTTRATVRAHSCLRSKPQPAMKPVAAFTSSNHPTKLRIGRSQTVTSGGGPLGIWITRPKMTCATMITTTPPTACSAEYAILTLAKKLVNEGSHMLDLCCAIVGEDEKAYISAILEKI